MNLAIWHASISLLDYTHFRDAKIADNVFLSTYGGREFKASEPEFRPVACLRSGRENTPGMRYCGGCGSPLSKEELARASVDYQLLLSEMSEIKELVSGLLSSKASKAAPQNRRAAPDDKATPGDPVPGPMASKKIVKEPICS